MERSSLLPVLRWEVSMNSQQVRIHGGKVEDIKDPKLKAILSDKKRIET